MARQHHTICATLDETLMSGVEGSFPLSCSAWHAEEMRGTFSWRSFCTTSVRRARWRRLVLRRSWWFTDVEATGRVVARSRPKARLRVDARCGREGSRAPRRGWAKCLECYPWQTC